MIDLDMPEDIYHAHPALSSTQARQLIHAPAKYLYEKNAPREEKKEWDVGTAVHTKVLGKGWPVVVIPDELLSGDTRAIRTKEARQWIADARAEGLIPIKQEEMAEVDAMAESVLAHPGARSVLEQPGYPEVSVFGTDPETGVETRARFDFLGDGPNIRTAVDLKTTRDTADALGFARTAAKFKYHVQFAHYLDTLRFHDENYVVNDFVFVVVEKNPPYLTGAHILDDVFKETGFRWAARARRRFAHGQATGEWPGHPGSIQVAYAPTYVMNDDIDASNAEQRVAP